MAGIVIESPSFSADIKIDCLIIGGGAAGLTASLAVAQAGLSVLIAERQRPDIWFNSPVFRLIPAADTNAQRRQQLEDDTGQFFSDIMAKNNHQADPAHVWRCINGVRAAINWLETDHDIPFSCSR